MAEEAEKDSLDELYDWLEEELNKPVWTLGSPFDFTSETISIRHVNCMTIAYMQRRGFDPMLVLYTFREGPVGSPFPLFDPDIMSHFWIGVKSAELKAAGNIMEAIRMSEGKE